MSSTRRRSSLSTFLSSVASKSLNNVRTEIDLSPLEVDLLISYQLSREHPSELGDEAFYVAKVANSKDMSTRITTALTRNGVLMSYEPDQSLDRLNVDTSKITRNFANQLPFCSAFMLRRIVSLLFLFEEQAMRWRVLDQEEAELRQLLTAPPAGLEGELQLRLQAVLGRKALLPSQQKREQTILDSELPAYTG